LCQHHFKIYISLRDNQLIQIDYFFEKNVRQGGFYRIFCSGNFGYLRALKIRTIAKNSKDKKYKKNIDFTLQVSLNDNANRGLSV